MNVLPYPIFAIALIAPVQVGATDVTGLAHIADGDTVEVGGKRIRLKGVDAPERGMHHGEHARSVLQEIVGPRWGLI